MHTFSVYNYTKDGRPELYDFRVVFTMDEPLCARMNDMDPLTLLPTGGGDFYPTPPEY